MFAEKCSWMTTIYSWGIMYFEQTLWTDSVSSTLSRHVINLNQFNNVGENLVVNCKDQQELIEPFLTKLHSHFIKGN